MKPLTKDLAQILKLLRAVRKHIDPDITVQRLQVLLEIAMAGEIDQGALSKRVDQTQSAVSKNVANLSDITATKRKGPGLVRRDIDPMRMTNRILSLTDKGKSTLQAVIKDAK